MRNTKFINRTWILSIGIYGVPRVRKKNSLKKEKKHGSEREKQCFLIEQRVRSASKWYGAYVEVKH